MRVRGVRLTVGAVLILLMVAAAWTAWQAWHVAKDLRAAQTSAERWRAALATGNATQRNEALADLRSSAASAHQRTDGPWWSVLTHLPLLGDDASGVRAISASLDVVANDAVPPLNRATDGLDGLMSDGRIDLDAVAGLQGPVAQAHQALARADGDVSG